MRVLSRQVWQVLFTAEPFYWPLKQILNLELHEDIPQRKS